MYSTNFENQNSDFREIKESALSIMNFLFNRYFVFSSEERFSVSDAWDDCLYDIDEDIYKVLEELTTSEDPVDNAIADIISAFLASDYANSYALIIEGDLNITDNIYIRAALSAYQDIMNLKQQSNNYSDGASIRLDSFNNNI